jgi:hypothetical protein
MFSLVCPRYVVIFEMLATSNLVEHLFPNLRKLDYVDINSMFSTVQGVSTIFPTSRCFSVPTCKPSRSEASLLRRTSRLYQHSPPDVPCSQICSWM